MEKVESNHLEVVAARVEKRKKSPREFQATRHQQDAAETATMLGEPKKTGWYAKLFKEHDRLKLIRCRDWVLKKKSSNPAALFTSQYQRFLKPYEERPNNRRSEGV